MKAWEVDLQVVAMEENTIKPLFTTIANIEDVANINVQFNPLQNTQHTNSKRSN
jgi:hypothetical protein